MSVVIAFPARLEGTRPTLDDVLVDFTTARLVDLVMLLTHRVHDARGDRGLVADLRAQRVLVRDEIVRRSTS